MGQMQSWDRMGIGIRLRVPEGAKGPLPTLLYHHAFDSARGEWELHEPSHFAPRWFLAKGYAAVSYSSRGNHSSCGFVQFQVTGDPPSHGPGGDPTCTEGYAHLAERSFETRDSQHLLGLLVDAHISDAERLAALGVSYGAGQTWLLATSTPWRTPSGLRSLQLAAAIPWAGWTDFWNAVVPNGRASDGWDQSASPERPHGVMKQGYDDGFYASQAQYPGFIRYNELKAGELHSFFRGWIEFWHKGEPYEISELPVVDKDGSVQTITASKLSAAFRNKSAYYAEDYFNAILQGTARPVPVLAVDGWSDTLFTPVESFQMYRKLKTLKPDYPVFLAFESGGLHGSLSLDVEKSYLFDRINQFLDKFLGTGGDGSLPPAVFSFRTQCPVPDDTRSGATLPPSVSGPDWDSVRTGVVTLERTETIKTNSALPNLAEESATDPVANPIRCMSQSAGSYDSSKGWTWRVDNAFTLLGLPTVKLTYTLLGEDATVVAKLWDVLPDGTRFLVTRGVYRLSVTTGDSQSGTLSFQLFGNHYRFEQGHSIALQLSQTDVTFLKPDSLPSSITFSAGRITLPIQ
jgi:predicted acyl esterase